MIKDSLYIALPAVEKLSDAPVSVLIFAGLVVLLLAWYLKIMIKRYRFWRSVQKTQRRKVVI